MSTGIGKKEVDEVLRRILASDDFAASPRLAGMLTFIVEQTLDGHGDRLKAFNIASHVFGRDETFDAANDPLVRVQASRLRKALERYFLTVGVGEKLEITIPKGGYVAGFRRVETARDAASLASTMHNASPTLAVVPFTTISRDGVQDYFASGITEEVTTALTQVENFRVISRQSADAYGSTGKTPSQIGSELSVRFIIKGTVQRSANAIRVSAALIDCVSEEQIWADTYSRDLKPNDIFEIRDEIARQVTARVGDFFGVIPRLLAKETRGIRIKDLDAYDSILRFFHYQTHLNRENYLWAKRGLEHAIENDPDYAMALAALAELACDNRILRFVEPYGGIDEAYVYARRAVSADPACQAAWYSMAFVKFHRRERSGCVEAANKVIELNPNSPYYVGIAGFVLALAGEWERGLEIMREASKLNPFYPNWFHIAPFQYHFFRKEFKEALAAAEKMNVPAAAWDPLTRLVALAGLGRDDDVSAVSQQLSREHPDFASYARDYISALVFEPENVDLLYKAYLDAAKVDSPDT